jgi:ferritin-like protein
MTDHQILMKHHSDRLGFISDGGAQGKAIKALLEKFTVADCIAYYNYQVMQLQPDGHREMVSWSTVWKQIAEWAKAGKPRTPAHFRRDVGRGDETEGDWQPNCKECKDVGMIWTIGKAEPCGECQALAA